MSPQQKAAATRMRNREERERRDLHARAESIRTQVEALSLAHRANHTAFSDESMQAVVGLFDRPGDSFVFCLLDEKPGLFRGYSGERETGWHALLRTVRNNPTFGRQMFARFRKLEYGEDA